MSNLFCQETWVNATEGHIVGESEVYETFTDNPGKLYRAMVREYGRCTGKVYIDTTNGRTKRIGWVFVKRAEYQDARHYRKDQQTYLQETWVTLHDAPETRTVEYHYHEFAN